MQQNKYIFLDVDGVLNSDDYFNHEGSQPFSISDHIDPKAVAILQTLIDATGAVIILSSTWRHGNLLDILKQRFSDLKFTGQIIDITGSDHVANGWVRGNSIYLWLKTHVSKLSTAKYVILDDDVDMLLFQADHFVHVNSQIGLTKANVDKAIQILNRDDA